MALKGPVAYIREEMVRERAAWVLSGQTVASPSSCPLIQRVLRDRLYTAYLESRRPWVLGTSMITTNPIFWDGYARVAKDPTLADWCEAWTRKPHRAWKRRSLQLYLVAAGIFEGEITDTWIYRTDVTNNLA